MLSHSYPFLRHVTAVVAVLLLAADGASAQQPSAVNPTAKSVQEQQLLDALKGSKEGTPAVSGRISIPDQRARNLIQPGGQDYRYTHQVTLPRIGMAAILGMLALLAIFLVTRGRIRVSNGLSGRMIERFGSFERFTHWMTSMSFILLALTGLNLTFGKSVLLPYAGPETFAMLTQWGKFVHNYVSFAFVLGIALMFLIWITDNIPLPRDIKWLAQGGGMIGDKHPPAGRFNGGQKLLFWVVVLGGAGLAYTGYNLMFPFLFADVGGLQWMSIVHGLIGVGMTAIIIGHIYIGTLGMQGAFSAMGSGKVDVNWAREHHSIWAAKVAGDKDVAATGAAAKPANRPQPAE